MATLSASTTFQVVATETYEVVEDLILLPENDGTLVRRELHYPNNVFPPIIYVKNPDHWTGFDSEPLEVPTLAVAKTIEGNKLGRWKGYITDQPIVETWYGNDRMLSMTADFFRRLMEYHLNPPTSGYIRWYPKDRTSAGYYVEIEKITVDDVDAAKLNYIATLNGYILGEVSLSLRIISEVV